MALVEPTTTIEIHLNVAEQRSFVEVQAKEPCFRMWLTRQEYERGKFADWPMFELSDGRVAVWRKESDLEKLQTSGQVRMWRAIMERRIDDDVV